tara:strand:- start:1665 stop:4058 length:2394 start_codon:yes stop_codon:yes gene_type:complete
MQIKHFSLKNNHIKILIIIFISLIIDNLFILKISSPPAWDQGYHLSNLFKMYNILDDQYINIFDKFDQLLNVTDNYRGPLTYFISALFLKLFDNSYQYAYLSNQIFNIISIISIYNLGKLLRNESTGIWASLIFAFSTLILNQRSDYLIDLSLTSFSTLGFLSFTKWYLDRSRFSFYSFLSGIALGLIFLTKPTGIIIFTFPFIFIIFKSIKSKYTNIDSFKEFIFFFTAFILLIFPWVSRNWLTIITSTINAWNWGINYQEGLDSNSIESWVFYFRKLPLMFGTINFSIFSMIILLGKTFKINLSKLKFKAITKINLYFLSYLLNCYLIVSLMSTKDIRFIMPIFPIFCIYISFLVDTNDFRFFKRSRKKIIIISIIVSLIFTKNGIIAKNYNNATEYEWPHYDIVREIKKENKYLKSTLAVLPDTREINTFNLEAEASRQGEYIAVRQVISNEATYKNDLEYFDWFLLKTGDQGVMTNESKNLLKKYLLNSTSFKIQKEWYLPDKSKIQLLKRKSLNSYLSKKDCKYNSKNINLKKISNGIRINLVEEGKFLKSSLILIDFIGEDFKTSTSFAFANGSFPRNLDEESCFSLTQDIPITFPVKLPKELEIKARVLDENGKIKVLNLEDKRIVINDKLDDDILVRMANKISKVELLGDYLRKGEFEKLFNLVGVINQSDPNQTYLKNAEKIYFQRYFDNKNLKDLYSVLICQILEREIVNAEKTINMILDNEFSNGNAHLAKAIINIYLFDKKDARLSLNNAKRSEKSEESGEIINIIEGLTYLLEFKFINAYKLLA